MASFAFGLTAPVLSPIHRRIHPVLDLDPMFRPVNLIGPVPPLRHRLSNPIRQATRKGAGQPINAAAEMRLLIALFLENTPRTVWRTGSSRRFIRRRVASQRQSEVCR
jgi:hypothetical protein